MPTKYDPYRILGVEHSVRGVTNEQIIIAYNVLSDRYKDDPLKIEILTEAYNKISSGPLRFRFSVGNRVSSIDTIRDLVDAAKKLPEGMREPFIEQNRNKITTFNDLLSVLSVLRPGEQILLFDSMGIKSQSTSAPQQLNLKIELEDYRTFALGIFEELPEHLMLSFVMAYKNEIKPIITNAEVVAYMLRKLPNDDRLALAIEFKDKINNAEALVSVFKTLSETDQRHFYNHLVSSNTWSAADLKNARIDLPLKPRHDYQYLKYDPCDVLGISRVHKPTDGPYNESALIAYNRLKEFHRNDSEQLAILESAYDRVGTKEKLLVFRFHDDTTKATTYSELLDRVKALPDGMRAPYLKNNLNLLTPAHLKTLSMQLTPADLSRVTEEYILKLPVDKRGPFIIDNPALFTNIGNLNAVLPLLTSNQKNNVKMAYENKFNNPLLYPAPPATSTLYEDPKVLRGNPSSATTTTKQPATSTQYADPGVLRTGSAVGDEIKAKAALLNQQKESSASHKVEATSSDSYKNIQPK